jgi:phage terminase large subunit-like protein
MVSTGTGLIKRDWLDDWRLPAAPLRPVKTVVGVDPSDSGAGDSGGIVAASEPDRRREDTFPTVPSHRSGSPSGWVGIVSQG